MNRKILISSLVLGLLPITTVPTIANAGVITCKVRQIKMAPGRYETKHICTYSKKGSSS